MSLADTMAKLCQVMRLAEVTAKLAAEKALKDVVEAGNVTLTVAGDLRKAQSEVTLLKASNASLTDALERATEREQQAAADESKAMSMWRTEKAACTVLRNVLHDQRKECEETNLKLQGMAARIDNLEKQLEQTHSVQELQEDLEGWRHLRNQPLKFSLRPHLNVTAQAILRTTVPEHHHAPCSNLRGLVIKQIREVRNVRLWKQYLSKRQQMHDCLQDRVSVPAVQQVLPQISKIAKAFPHIFLQQSVNEVLLLHGTSEQSANLIAEQGFDETLCKRHFYGTGIYFSPEVCKASEYTDGSGRFVIVVARVCIGHFFLAEGPRQRQQRAPMVPGTCCPHDSVIAVQGISKGRGKGGQVQKQVHSEVLICRGADYQTYPEMLITVEVP